MVAREKMMDASPVLTVLYCITTTWEVGGKRIHGPTLSFTTATNQQDGVISTATNRNELADRHTDVLLLLAALT